MKDVEFANKVIRNLQADPVHLHYQWCRSDDSLKIVIFADAAHGNLLDGESQGGKLIFVVGEHRACSLISWQSIRIQTVLKISLAADTLSVSEAVDGAVYSNTLFSEISYGGSRKFLIEIVTDNKSVCDALHSSKSVSSKWLIIKIGYLKEMLQKEDIVKIHWAETNDQIAGSLTKHCASSRL